MLALTPYTNLTYMNNMRKDLDKMFNRLMGFSPELTPETGAAMTSFLPVANVKENQEAVFITMELPGVKADDVEVNLTGNLLTIKGEKKDSSSEEKGDYHVVERRYGSFQRSFRLPMDIDRDKVAATNKDGLLTITLPKAVREASKNISVTAE